MFVCVSVDRDWNKKFKKNYKLADKAFGGEANSLKLKLCTPFMHVVCFFWYQDYAFDLLQHVDDVVF